MQGTIDWLQIEKTANLLAIVEQDAPKLQGTFNGVRTKEVPCPKCGGVTRFRVRMRGDGIIRAYCSHCAEKGLNAIDYLVWRDGLSRLDAARWWSSQTNTLPELVTPIPQPLEPLDMALAVRHHNNMTTASRDYLYRRGMLDAMINHFKVGYHTGWRRYSFPFIIGTKLWGIQYRLDPRMEYVLKYLSLFGVEHPLMRYISEKGSHNHGVYACKEIQNPWPYAVLIEGVPDVVAMWSQGFPTISTFQGNNKSKAWDRRWNRYLDHLDTVLVIPDNDASGAGELFALSKVEAIGKKAVIHRLPAQYKDVGEFIMADVTTAQHRLAVWLCLPPIRDSPLARTNVPV